MVAFQSRLTAIALGTALVGSGALSNPERPPANDTPLTRSPVAAVNERECAAKRPIITSELSVQLYVIASIGGTLVPLGGHVVVATDANRRDWSAKTDTRGFVELGRLPPGNYRLHVPYEIIEPLYQDVTITRRGARSTVAAIANLPCGTVCTVPFVRSPLGAPPECLSR
jgi:hypothetical protein